MAESAEDKEMSGQAKVSWRILSVNNVKSLARVADRIHPDLSESEEVFAERVRLFPEGCLGLVEGKGNELCGYVISHPIRRFQPPALNSLLEEIAPDADQYYIHDLAILPELRRRGLAQLCIKRLLAVANRYATTCLISVYGTQQFWNLFGFVPVRINDVLETKLLNYGNDAVYLERENKEYQQ